MADEINYKQTDVSGESWQRAVSVLINNPLNGVPNINIQEEAIYTLGDKIIKENIDPFKALRATFDINNPLHLELYDVLNRVYIELRELRDNPPVQEPSEPEPGL